MANYMDVYKKWLEDEFFDAATKEELISISGDAADIEDRFYRTLEFGTAGLRGVIGAGTNRMNIYTVRQATQGLANYILKQDMPEGRRGVAIAYDCRRMSREFARETALCFCANGVKAYLFEELRPTPELSFAVRTLGVCSGVVITASHNPREYNGYKVYWEDGAQVPYPRDEAIITEVMAVEFSQCLTMDYDAAIESGMLTIIGAEIDEAYYGRVMEQRVNPGIAEESGLRAVYTPLNGTGNIPVRRVLADCGYDITVVPEQELPDPDFTTVGYPNPEDPKAFALAIKLAEETNADIIIATDPDADRIGVAVLADSGQFTVLSGNMIGTLLCEYILTQRKEKDLLPERPAVVSTIVSSKLTRDIAEGCGVKYFEVLTGFKNICGKMREFEEGPDRLTSVFAFEESNGCLSGDYVRDKDGVVTCMLVCEMAAFYKLRGMSLFDALTEMYQKYGFYLESTVSIALKGIEGAAKIRAIMERLHGESLKSLNGVKITRVTDVLNNAVHDLELDVHYPANLPKSDVLLYNLADESWFCVRPSGTEPKIKIYCGVKGADYEDALNRMTRLKDAVTPLVSAE